MDNQVLEQLLQEAEEFYSLTLSKKQEEDRVLEQLVHEMYVKYARVRQVRKLAEIASSHLGVRVTERRIHQIAQKLNLQGVRE